MSQPAGTEVVCELAVIEKDLPPQRLTLEHTGRFGAAAAAYSGALTADPGYDKAKQNLARVEAVKEDREEPFELEATANQAVEEPKVSGDETAAAR